MTDNLDLALELAARGWHIFPCKTDKIPIIPSAHPEGDPLRGKCHGECGKEGHGFHDATKDPGKIRAWWATWPGALLGIACEKSGFFALDLDRKGDVNGLQELTRLVNTCGAGADVLTGPIQRTPSGGYHLLYKLPDNLKIPNNAGKLAPGIDLRSAGYICSGGAYEWQPEHGPMAPLTEAPAWLLDLIRNMTERRPAPQDQAPQPVAMGSGAGDPGGYWLQYYLDRATPGDRNEHGFYLACQLRDSNISESEAAGIMASYAGRVPGQGYTEREAMASLKSAYNGAKREAAHLPGVTFSTNGHNKTNDVNPHTDNLSEPEPGAQPEKILLTDMGNARRFALQHNGKVKFANSWGWMIWTGKRWERDETGHIMAMAKQTAKSLYREAEQAEDKAKAAIRAAELAIDQNDESALKAATDKRDQARRLADSLLSWALKSQGRPRLEAMVKLAESEPEIKASTNDFDLDPWALNCKNGILDLKTGALRSHDPGALITKLANVEYNPAANCPIWLKFLDKIFSGDQSMIAFLQRATGYSLTGDIREQALFLSLGHGANGKSTFTGAIQAMLGDYSMKTRAETLMVNKYNAIPEEIAQLAGARFMLAQELGEGQQLNEQLIKDLTGGDKLRGRLLYQKSFEYWPVAKPWLYGNHMPEIKNTDNGIWRRVKLIPFEVTIPEHEQDKELPEKLKAELPGILAWAVQGCLEWQRIGLAYPERVKKATEEYRADQDIIGKFLEDCCVINSLATVTAGDLYATYHEWAEKSGLKPISSIEFSRQLAERGYSTRGPDGKPKRLPGSGKAYISGLGLLAPAPTDQSAGKDDIPIL